MWFIWEHDKDTKRCFIVIEYIWWLLCYLVLKLCTQVVCENSCYDMSHKIECGQWLILCMLIVKLYYEIR